MRAESIRRLLVFGVCALGVTALYLVPTTATRVAAPTRTSSPPTQHTSTPYVRERVPADADPTPTAEPVIEPAAARESATTVPESTRSRTRSWRPPAPAGPIRIERSTADGATVSWARVDDPDVVAYAIWLNGFLVDTTQETTARVRWFNDDSREQLVQIRTVDAGGHQSARAATVVARRVDPSPSATPSRPSESSPTPSLVPPSSSPTPTPDPTGEPSAVAPVADSTSTSPDPVETPN